MHYLDENSESEEVVLLMHGEPTWSYFCLLYTSDAADEEDRAKVLEILDGSGCERLLKS